MPRVGDFLLPALGVGVLAALAASEVVVRDVPPPGRVHISYWEKWTGFEGDAMRAVVDEFNRTQNDIFVDLLTVSDIQNKTMLAVSAGIPPDVAGLFGANVPQYADDQAVMLLDDYCREAGIGPEDYKPVYWATGNYRGHIYSLPSTPASTALHYNTDLMRKAGLDPNKPPRTIEELTAMADRMTKKQEDKILVSGFLPSEPGWWNWAWGHFFGGELWDGKSKITINSPENVRAFEWVQSFSKKYGPAELQTFKSGFGNFSSPQNAFMQNQVGMELQGVWMYNFITMYAKDLKWAAAPFPPPAGRPDLANTTIAEQDVLVIPRGAKHPKEAFEFIKFVQSQKGMELLCLGQKKNSPLTQVSDEFWKQHPNPYVRLFDELASSPNAVATPAMGIWTEYGAEINNAYDEIVLMKKTPKKALDDVAARMQPKLDQYLRRLALREKVEGG
ncbi:MAG TPA: ABC transporter substrate-binding protein [Fimbriimonas sp.]